MRRWSDSASHFHSIYIFFLWWKKADILITFGANVFIRSDRFNWPKATHTRSTTLRYDASGLFQFDGRSESKSPHISPSPNIATMIIKIKTYFINFYGFGVATAACVGACVCALKAEKLLWYIAVYVPANVRTKDNSVISVVLRTAGDGARVQSKYGSKSIVYRYIRSSHCFRVRIVRTLIDESMQRWMAWASPAIRKW